MNCGNTGLLFLIALSLVFGANHARAARVDIEAERFGESNVPAKVLDDATSDKLSHSLIGRCECVFGVGEPFQVDTSQCVRADSACIDSMTGELTRTSKTGLLHIKAPKLQGVVRFTDGEAVDLGDVRMTLDPTGEISVTVAALDEKPLRKSQRMFLCAVGEVNGTGVWPAWRPVTGAAERSQRWALRPDHHEE